MCDNIYDTLELVKAHERNRDHTQTGHDPALRTTQRPSLRPGRLDDYVISTQGAIPQQDALESRRRLRLFVDSHLEDLDDESYDEDSTTVAQAPVQQDDSRKREKNDNLLLT